MKMRNYNKSITTEKIGFFWAAQWGNTLSKQHCIRSIFQWLGWVHKCPLARPLKEVTQKPGESLKWYTTPPVICQGIPLSIHLNCSPQTDLYVVRYQLYTFRQDIDRSDLNDLHWVNLNLDFSQNILEWLMWK